MSEIIPERLSFRFVRGDSFAIPLFFVDPKDEKKDVDVSGYKLKFTVKTSQYLPDATAVISKNIVLPPETSNGQYVLVLEPEDTVDLAATGYDCDLQLTSSDESIVITLGKGRLVLDMSSTWEA